MNFADLSIMLVGPMPTPPGGMANQTRQLAQCLHEAGAKVEVVHVNPPYVAGVANWRGMRALFRLLPYLLHLWRASARADLIHVMANSGWAWHLHAAPAIWIGVLRARPVVLHYHGGEAAEFLARRTRVVRLSLRRVSTIVVPSAFLARVFGQHGYHAHVVPNIIDLSRFSPAPQANAAHDGPALLVARHLEPVYDIASALRAFALIRQRFPQASLRVAGIGPEYARLVDLAAALGITGAVRFTGRIDNSAMPKLYRQADLVLNPSLADNMPLSVLEALACAVPVVSTDVGGIPDLLSHGTTALLVAPGDHVALANAAILLLSEPQRAERLRLAGLLLVRRYCWESVAPALEASYRRALRHPRHSAYTKLVATLLFPLHEWCKGHRTVALRHALELSQWWSAAQLRALQLERLRALLIDVQTHVPYYRELFARYRIDPRTLDSLGALARLPLLCKADIRDAGAQFRADDAATLARFGTGGSSGEPLVFWIGKRRVSADVAAKWRATRWWDVDIGARELVVWGSPIELQAQDRVRRLRDWLLRSRLLPAFDMGTPKLDAFLARIRKQRPSMLFGYPSALCLIARHAKARRVALDECGVRVVFVTSERLYPDQRAQIGESFGCPVANGYGGRDAGFIAHECPAGGMHISAEDVIVEIVDDQGAPVPIGTIGQIVVTHLATRDFPFIRYKTGDVGALDAGACPCGRGLPLLKHLEGRSTDFVHAQDGSVMHGLALIYILRELPQIRAFKIVQESVAQTRVLVVAAPSLGPTMRHAITRRFQERLGAGVAIVIDEVNAIAPDPSGKFRYVISHVAAP